MQLAECTSGVWIFGTPPGTGKTTATRHALRSLQRQKLVGGAIVVNCGDIAQFMSESKIGPSVALRQHLYHTMGIPSSSRVPHLMSALFANVKKQGRVVVVLDQFELLRRAVGDNDRELHLMIKAMALEAVQSNVYTVLVNVGDRELAKQMLDWNNKQTMQFILPIEPAWTQAELEEAVQQYRQHDPRLSTMTDAEAKAVLASVKTIGDIVNARDRFVAARSEIEIKHAGNNW